MSNTQSSKFKTFGFIFALSIVALTLTLWAKGIIYASVLALLIFVILLITKRLWIPEGYGKYRVRMTSLSVMLTAALSFGFWQGFVESAVMLLIESLWPGMASRFTIRDVSPYALLGFLLLAVGLINYFNRDKTAMCDHPKPINEDIWPKIDKKILKGICNCLKDDLEEIDRKTNWSAQHFTPLDAEVIVDTGDTTKKRITDLLRAIKKSDDRVFLVLGEPGSGKSVALRKLARDLLKKAPETGKIPIYINLKEWWMDEQWSEANPPTSQQLYAFVQENLRSRDPISREFFDKKFAPLHAYGRLYYILDSFDEIPTVLDEGEDSELIHQLSEIIFKFLKGARTESSQGILASRISRQPTKEFK
ncbi:MAG: ATP-binding protein, partial [bacterium]|nr:ATP-binding protein [bacterium]